VDPSTIVGVLLACGAGTRFGGHKLVHPLDDGTPLAVASLRALKGAVAQSIAVIRSGDAVLKELLAREGATVVECSDCHAGIGHSIAAGVRASADAGGWLIALADMPFVLPASVAAVADGIRRGALICAPSYRGQRGHPVGFRADLYPELTMLRGDQGARSIIERHHDDLAAIDCNDAGVLCDIDTRSDLPVT
jgi:molybdenum cofactor cytidylyltransferase